MAEARRPPSATKPQLHRSTYSFSHYSPFASPSTSPQPATQTLDTTASTFSSAPSWASSSHGRPSDSTTFQFADQQDGHGDPGARREHLVSELELEATSMRSAWQRRMTWSLGRWPMILRITESAAVLRIQGCLMLGTGTIWRIRLHRVEERDLLGVSHNGGMVP